MTPVCLVLICGTHLGRYVEEQIQREGVAMETSGFTFVTSGKKKKTLTGPATMVAFPHFRPLSDNAAVIDNL